MIASNRSVANLLVFGKYNFRYKRNTSTGAIKENDMH